MAATLELAISAIRSGRTEEGRQLLNLLIQENPNNDKAWLWMSSVVNTDDQRARCLYHVLAIDPNSELARRGLNVLGIVVSDSRPVKIPRDSRPIEIPKPTPAGQQRRPFLIDPQAIADELPFTPVTGPYTETVEASPAILSIDVENEAKVQGEPEAQPADPSPPVPITASAKTQALDTQPLPDQSQQGLSKPEPVVSSDQVQGLASPVRNPSEPGPGPNGEDPGAVWPPQSSPVQLQSARQRQSSGLPDAAPPAGPEAQSAALQAPPVIDAGQQLVDQPAPNLPGSSQPHPSQPMPVVVPTPAPGMPPNGQTLANPMPSYGLAGQANIPLGMPSQQALQPQSPSYPMPPSIHANPTMGMSLQTQTQQLQHPSEPVPVINSSNPLGMSPFGQPQMPPPLPGPALHSNSTMMMPSLPEVEARAQLAASQPISAANPMLAYQPSGMAGDPMANVYGSMHGAETEARENEEQGVNILAVIIFGTLSVTALGGLGMLILLVFTAPMA